MHLFLPQTVRTEGHRRYFVENDRKGEKKIIVSRAFKSNQSNLYHHLHFNSLTGPLIPSEEVVSK